MRRATSAAHYVFAYGSLLSPVSLLSTLPDVDVDSVAVARLLGHRRVFDVAFPNDGSQSDKAYFDEAGQRPPSVLFNNVTRDSSTKVNGVLVPVSEAQLQALRERERPIPTRLVRGFDRRGAGRGPRAATSSKPTANC